MSVVKTLLNPDDDNDWEPTRKERKKAKPTPLCPACQSAASTETLDHTPSLVYSRIHCADCGEFITMGRDPAITKACELRDQLIIKIMDNFELNRKEVEMMNSRLYERFATPNQRAWMDKIAIKTLGHPFDWSAYEKRPSG